jgi:uncharacterized protein
MRVIKCSHESLPVWEYQADVIAMDSDHAILQAFFDIDDRDDGYFVWQKGDRFIEWYFADRWYNVFRIHDRDTDAIRGWYCNITRPARLQPDAIQWDDLALDVLIRPDGEFLLLDEDEFNAVPITPTERLMALGAVEALRKLALAHAEFFAPV